MEAYRLLNLILLVHCLQVVKIDSLNSQFRLPINRVFGFKILFARLPKLSVLASS
jgi:hypothetical protein